jgi:hypothetical protein
MDLYQPRVDQFEACEEPGHLLPGAQGLRGGDALVVNPLRVRWDWWMSIAGWEIVR